MPDKPFFVYYGARRHPPTPRRRTRVDGYSRDQRPDLNQVMLDLIVEHQAGIPVLMKPRNGNRSDAHDFGQIITDHMAQLQTTYGTTFLVADSALYSAENLQKLAETRLKWSTRVPATWREAQAVLAQADPQTMAPLTQGYRYRVVPSSSGVSRNGGCSCTLSPPTASPAHCRQAMAQAECRRSQSLQDAVPHGLCL